MSRKDFPWENGPAALAKPAAPTGGGRELTWPWQPAIPPAGPGRPGLILARARRRRVGLWNGFGTTVFERNERIAG